ncbi:Serine/threonine-protein kinase RIO3 [Hypsibius exemplaris]|uniref:Serine/threonine-protein kinase RIO3 n=1 Tax=Hypsibius exemplaris TaxID=2072580 RepID=A0A1W0X434_HYPEX|nr:Serine/threonine-protein kinase RIO3 [Hypsibius exemplaris]
MSSGPVSVSPVPAAPGQSEYLFNDAAVHAASPGGNFVEGIARRPPPVSAWSTPKAASPSKTSLADVMSEQLAAQLGTSPQKSDGNLKNSVSPVPGASVTADGAMIPPEMSEQEQSDHAIAQLLQYEMDLEHDAALQRLERHRNGQSKISVSYANYRHLHPVESRDELDPLPDFPEPVLATGKPPDFNGRGYSGKGKNIITKHDSDVCGRRNADRVMTNFPPSFATGDDYEYDSIIPNKVFNQLRVHSESTEKRAKRNKDKKEDDATASMAVDQKTRLLMYKMVNGGVLNTINGIVSTGKESVVFHATGGEVEELKITLPEECALKVFKTTLNEFRNRDPYIRDDYRFQERYSHLNPRKIVKLWAEKEMLNLKRMIEHGVPCPEALLLRKHILVLRFLGKEQKAAPKLKDVELSSQQRKRAYEETVQIVKKMYNDCKLIHADLSEYNLLWHEEKVWVIDVSQSVEPGHPRAMEFLYRDCKNVENFFTKIGVENVLTAKELLESVSGVKVEGDGEELLPELQRHGGKKEKPHKFNPEVEGASFDHLFDMATRERSQAATAVDAEDDWELIDDDDSDSDAEEV